MESFLSTEQKIFFEENGYLLVENFLSSAECDALKDECHRIVEDMDLADHRVQWNLKASGTEVYKKNISSDFESQKYYLDSWKNMGYFFEKDALDKDGNLLVPKHESIFKIAHSLHFHSDLFHKAIFEPRVKAICKDLNFTAPRVSQSMYIFKNPKIGGLVDTHQDATFLWTEPSLKLLGLWVALEDATQENGCLWFIPKSHKTGLLDERRFVRKDVEAEVTQMVFRGADPNMLVNKEDFIPGEVTKGSLVLIDGCVVHRSEENRSKKSREIFTWHIVDLPAGVTWSRENWIRPDNEDSFSAIY